MMCSNDEDGKALIGDVNEQTVQQIWQATFEPTAKKTLGSKVLKLLLAENVVTHAKLKWMKLLQSTVGLFI